MLATLTAEYLEIMNSIGETNRRKAKLMAENRRIEEERIEIQENSKKELEIISKRKIIEAFRIYCLIKEIQQQKQILVNLETEIENNNNELKLVSSK